ncbi:MAG: hypothetical protein ACKV0T_21915 [Planctomycetales bacterium]
MVFADDERRRETPLDGGDATLRAVLEVWRTREREMPRLEFNWRIVRKNRSARFGRPVDETQESRSLRVGELDRDDVGESLGESGSAGASPSREMTEASLQNGSAGASPSQESASPSRNGALPFRVGEDAVRITMGRSLIRLDGRSAPSVGLEEAAWQVRSGAQGAGVDREEFLAALRSRFRDVRQLPQVREYAVIREPAREIHAWGALGDELARGLILGRPDPTLSLGNDTLSETVIWSLAVEAVRQGVSPLWSGEVEGARADGDGGESPAGGARGVSGSAGASPSRGGASPSRGGASPSRGLEGVASSGGKETSLGLSGSAGASPSQVVASPSRNSASPSRGVLTDRFRLLKDRPLVLGMRCLLIEERLGEGWEGETRRLWVEPQPPFLVRRSQMGTGTLLDGPQCDLDYDETALAGNDVGGAGGEAVAWLPRRMVLLRINTYGDPLDQVELRRDSVRRAGEASVEDWSPSPGSWVRDDTRGEQYYVRRDGTLRMISIDDNYLGLTEQELIDEETEWSWLSSWGLARKRQARWALRGFSAAWSWPWIVVTLPVTGVAVWGVSRGIGRWRRARAGLRSQQAARDNPSRSSSSGPAASEVAP